MTQGPLSAADQLGRSGRNHLAAVRVMLTQWLVIYAAEIINPRRFASKQASFFGGRICR
jgi:hypothetical protein